jgi:hypothetical protein
LKQLIEALWEIGVVLTVDYVISSLIQYVINMHINKIAVGVTFEPSAKCLKKIKIRLAMVDATSGPAV